MENYSGPERRGTLNGIERDTFKQMETDDKINVLFDYHVSLHNLIYRLLSEQCPRQAAACGTHFTAVETKIDDIDKRVKPLESSRWWNTAASGVGGVIGGFVAITAKWLLESKG